MKRYSGNLLSILGSMSSEEGQKTCDTYEVRLIDAHDIVPNEKNFYGIREVEELATRMKISGHITPLEVVARDDEPGKYTLLSGERRRAAVLYRLEQGEIDKAVMPCIVREDLDSTEDMTAEEIETINIICANDYRDKTPFEKLDEVHTLKPIARKCWEKGRKGGALKHQNDFRAFFAKEFLGISPSALQRITILENLVPEARQAYEEELIGKVALSELAYQSEEEQQAYIEGLRTGENDGTIADVQGKDAAVEDESPQEDEAFSSPEIFEDEEPAETEMEPEQSPVVQETVKAPKSLDMDKAEAEAREWVREGLKRLVEEAESEMEAARAKDDSSQAALWDLRRAAACVAIEAMK